MDGSRSRHIEGVRCAFNLRLLNSAVSAWSDDPSKDFPSSLHRRNLLARPRPPGPEPGWRAERLPWRDTTAFVQALVPGTKICRAANYGFQMSPPPSDTAFERFTSSLPGCSLPFRLFLRGRQIYAAWATVYRSNGARWGCQADGQPPVVEKPEPAGCFVGGCLCGSGTHVHPTFTLHIITV